MLNVYSHPEIEQRLKAHFEVEERYGINPYFTFNENLDSVEVDIYYERKGKVGNKWIYGFTHAVCESGNNVSELLLSKTSFAEITTLIHDFDRGQYVSAHASICIPLATFGRLYCYECMYGNFSASSGYKTRKAGKLNMGRRKDFINEIILSYDDPTFPSIWEFDILYWKIDHHIMDDINPYHSLLGKRCTYLIKDTHQAKMKLNLPIQKVSKDGNEHQAVIHDAIRKHLNPILNYGRCMAIRSRVLSIRVEGSKNNIPTMFDAYIVKITEHMDVKVGMRLNVVDGKESFEVIVSNVDHCKYKYLNVGDYVTVTTNIFGEVHLIN